MFTNIIRIDYKNAIIVDVDINVEYIVILF